VTEKTYPYYEIHLIVDGPADSKLIFLCQSRGYWPSTLESDEGNEEEPGQVILTSREVRQELAVRSIEDMAETLSDAGIKLLRYKVEHIILDSKVSDELELLA
jgi:hypothetical protein